MDPRLLQRIVGAAVLVALAVIFIPALLDGSGYKSRQLQHIQFKPEPHFPPLSQQRPPRIKSPLTAVRDEQIKKRAEKKTSNKVVTKPDRASRPLQAFALQAGTFDNSANARKLRDKLRKMGYVSFLTTKVKKGKKNYKVRIGPELERNTLEKIRIKLKKRYKINAYVVNYP